MKDPVHRDYGGRDNVCCNLGGGVAVYSFYVALFEKVCYTLYIWLNRLRHLVKNTLCKNIT